MYPTSSEQEAIALRGERRPDGCLALHRRGGGPDESTTPPRRGKGRRDAERAGPEPFAGSSRREYARAKLDTRRWRLSPQGNSERSTATAGTLGLLGMTGSQKPRKGCIIRAIGSVK